MLQVLSLLLSVGKAFCTVLQCQHCHIKTLGAFKMPLFSNPALFTVTELHTFSMFCLLCAQRSVES